jgi:Co/Zn/Cd efflux system component
VGEVETQAEQRTLRIALALNATMFIVGMTARLLVRSSALLADALDMLTDASAYAIALLAIRRRPHFKQRAAFASGLLLCMLGLSVMGDAVRRAVAGGVPIGIWMLVVATLSLAVNSTVLRMLAPYRSAEVHLRATWLFTRADVIANIGVIVAALLVLTMKSRLPDLVIALAIGAYVLKEALEILVSASRATR